MIVIVWLAFVVACALWGNAKGHLTLGLIFGLLLGPLGLVLVAVLSDKRKVAKPEPLAGVKAWSLKMQARNAAAPPSNDMRTAWRIGKAKAAARKAARRAA